MKGRVEGPEVRQELSEHSAECLDCGSKCDARNAQAWATNHVKKNPSHAVTVDLRYVAKAVGMTRIRADEPALL